MTANDEKMEDIIQDQTKITSGKFSFSRRYLKVLWLAFQKMELKLSEISNQRTNFKDKILQAENDILDLKNQQEMDKTVMSGFYENDLF